jgi:hypothetical protein
MTILLVNKRIHAKSILRDREISIENNETGKEGKIQYKVKRRDGSVISPGKPFSYFT